MADPSEQVPFYDKLMGEPDLCMQDAAKIWTVLREIKKQDFVEENMRPKMNALLKLQGLR